jgi:xanthine/CO dehydrogenase XdhC/CoxF family maturation factor
MSELGRILELWRDARESGEEICLTTVVEVEGSSYRKPGAHMLLTRAGRRAGTISGGCLEAEVQKKAWWLTESGATDVLGLFFDDLGARDVRAGRKIRSGHQLRRDAPVRQRPAKPAGPRSDCA